MPITSDQITSPTQFVKIVEPSSTTQEFAINHEKFGHLATPEQFSQLKPHLIEVDISNQMNTLTEDGFMEISVPVLGLTDFLANSPTWHDFAQQFPVPVAINQFGSPEGDKPDYYPQADFVVVKDLLGNEFELFVNADGLIDIPENGDGRFSVITEITYIFSTDQIIEGRGFYTLEDVGAEAGKLYLLPPPGSHFEFNIQIATAHLDELNQKVIAEVMNVPVVQMDNEVLTDNLHVAVNNLSNEKENMLQLDVQFLKKNYNGSPFSLNLGLQEETGINYKLFNQDAYWEQATSQDSILSKQVGLSEYGLTALVRNIFSEYDFTKSLLLGESFELSNQSGFNNFQLSPEAVGLYYDLFVSGLVSQTLPGEWLFAHVPKERFEDLDLDYAALDDHDQAIINQITEEVKMGHYDILSEYFYDPDKPAAELVQESIYVIAEGAPNDFVPEANLNVQTVKGETLDGLIDHFGDSLIALEQGIQPTQNEINLSPDHEAITIHYSDIVENASPTGTLIKGFDFNHDKLNLGDLIESGLGLSQEHVHTEIDGSDVHVRATNPSTGEEITVATLVGVNQPDSNIELPGTGPGGFIEFDT